MSRRPVPRRCAPRRARLPPRPRAGAGRSLAAAALLLVLSGVAGAADLTVAAAASLVNAFKALAPVYEASHPGAKVVLTFGASDALVAQVEQGAPVDVLASADQAAMDRADAKRLLVPGTRRDFAGNALVVIVPAVPAPGGPQALPAALADLARPTYRHVALGRPAGVPAGRYARGALEAANLWSAIEPRAVYAQNVRQALDFVSRGEAEAGFVYATDAAIARDTVRVAFTVPTPSPITYPVAAVAGSPDPAGARAFVEFLATPAARAVLARYGFTAP